MVAKVDAVLDAPTHDAVSVHRGCARRVLGALDDWLGHDLHGVPATAKADMLRDLQAARARLAALELRLLAGASDAARAGGHRDTAAWYAEATRSDPGRARSVERAATTLASAPRVAQALESGAVGEQHAATILTCLDHLGPVSPTLRTRAADRLLEHATRMTPARLRTCGKGILDEVDPGGRDRQLARTLADEAARAWAATRLTLHDNLDGTTALAGTVPTPVASRIKTVLDACASPRRAARASGTGGAGAADGTGDANGADGTGDITGGAAAENPRVPYATRLGWALCTLVEHLDPAGLPQHGRTATTLVVTIDHRELTERLGVAHLADPDRTPVSAGEARRLACSAALVPAVLGTGSQTLDLGRAARLFSPAQVTALRLRDHHCQAEGCSIPATWCEAHHLDPWSKGGATDLANGVLLCAYHHHRVHDPGWQHRRRPDGRLVLAPRETGAGPALKAVRVR